MKLYTSFGPNPAVVTAFLAEKRQALETVRLDITRAESGQPSFMQKNPAGTVPLLELDDGTYIAESLAICEYLDEVLPGPGSLIGDSAVARAQTRMWLRRLDLHIIQPSSYGRRYAEGIEFCKNFRQVIPQAANDFKLMAAQGIKWLDVQMGASKYICGDRVTLADILLYVFVEFGNVNGQPIDPSIPWLSRWRVLMAGHRLAKVLHCDLPSYAAAVA